MFDQRASAARRLGRRRRHAGARSWLTLLQLNPRRASLHLTVLSIGALTFVGSALVQRPGPESTIQVDQSAVAGVAVTNLDQPAELGVAADLSPVQAEVPTAPAPQITTYVVESGDTLNALAERFGVSVATIAAANKLANPDSISIGQELIILPMTGVLHTPDDGETLSQVAQRFGVDAAKVASVNRLAPTADPPLAGHKLVVPDVEPELPSKPAAVARAATTPQGGGAADPADEQARVLVDLEGEEEVAEEPAADEQPVAEKPAAPARAPSPVEYEVQPGDTVRSLADIFGVSIRTILAANDLADPDMIKAGMKLKVLPVSGIEHVVDKGESLADIAMAYQVDMGPIVDFNGIGNPDVLSVGDKLIIPGATGRIIAPPPAPAPVAAAAPAAAAASAPAASSASTSRPAAPSLSAAAAAPAAARTSPAASGVAAAQAKPQAAPKPASAVSNASIAVPAPAVVGGGGAGIVSNAMRYLGSRYVFGGTSPAGFDCSGFVWYVHNISGISTGRGLHAQMGGGTRVSRENLQPGDTVFFANTYMPGLSHAGIYVGGGNFIHAIDEGSGVGISSLGSGYWGPRFVGATRIGR